MFVFSVDYTNKTGYWLLRLFVLSVIFVFLRCFIPVHVIQLLMTCCRSLSCVPPSQDAHPGIPHIAPDSPTDISGPCCENSSLTASEKLHWTLNSIHCVSCYIFVNRMQWHTVLPLWKVSSCNLKTHTILMADVHFDWSNMFTFICLPFDIVWRSSYAVIITMFTRWWRKRWSRSM